MSTSRLATVIDNLITVFTADPGLADVLVLDGPQASADHGPSMLFVGGDGGDDLDEPTKATQEWAHANHTAKNETGTVDCVLFEQDGTTEIPRLRTQAYALLAVCEDVLRGDPTIAGAVLYADISEHRLDQQQTERGALARVIFTVRYTARI